MEILLADKASSRNSVQRRTKADMFKWVMPALASRTNATTIAVAARTTRTTTATSTTTATTTTAITKRQLLSNALTTLIIIGALFVQTTSGFRSTIETNGGKHLCIDI